MRRIAILFGGKSPEHEISVRSARNINGAIDKRKFEVMLIGVDRGGCWRLIENYGDWKFVPEEGAELALVPGKEKGKIINTTSGEALPDPEAIFLIIHGPNGEDGTIQGLLRIMDLPFIGPDVLGSSVAMDKAYAKTLLSDADINVANGMVVNVTDKESLNYDSITIQLGSPIFIKPANMGSSVGVHKVNSAAEFGPAIEDAFKYDHKILIEEMIHGRELECAVLGNEFPKVSKAGEILVVSEEEYSFDAKYTSATAAKVIVPAEVSETAMEALRKTAIKAYKALNCEVLSRVDMFLTESGKVYVNEINTLPGFTSISMYPKLWEEAGLSYTDLITQLIQHAIERFKRQQKLKTDW
ncbi:MAG: D-alanine--D-alanine ligase family protein [Bacteroidota bacterium]